jgi:glycosidase
MLKILLILLSLSATGHSQVNSTEQKKESKEITLNALKSFKQYNRDLKYSDSPNYWGSQIVYQIQIDRFNDGDPSNNKENLEDFQIQGDQSKLMNFRHGGDLAGIINRLPYLKDLGVTSLWITPIFQHNGSYHGYCTTDFYNVDPGFGTKELFRELVRKAHNQGIRIVLDIVINHMCSKGSNYDPSTNDQINVQDFNHQQCTNDLDIENWQGKTPQSRFQKHLNFSPDFFKFFKFEKFFNRCGANSKVEMQGSGPAAIYGDFVNGMFDFNTRDSDFQELFTEMLKYWIAYSDLDGYRFDAAKHVSEDYVAYLSTYVRDFASSIGKNNFLIVGEVAGPSDWIGRRLGHMYLNPSNPQNEHGNVPLSVIQILETLLKPIYLKNSVFPNPGMNAVYDFAHGGNALATLHNFAPSVILENHFRSEYYNDIAGQADPRLSWNLLEIHDWPRFASYNPNSLDKSKLGVAYLAAAEGTPVIYYGMEQGFNGICPTNQPVILKDSCAQATSNDAFYRQDMFISGPFRLGSTVPEIQKLAGFTLASLNTVESNSTHLLKDPYLNQDQELYKTTRKFLHLRQSCKALSYGHTFYRWSEPNSNNGLLAFSRLDERSQLTDPAREVLVIINTGNEPIILPRMRVNSNINSSSKIWINLFNGYQVAKLFTISENNNESTELDFNNLKINTNSVMIFAPLEAAQEYDKTLDVHLCK